MFQNDYILREIENLSRLVANVFFHKDSSTLEIVDEQGRISERGLLYCKLKVLLHDGKIVDGIKAIRKIFEHE